jgi:predicted TIM-barrel fold metal-dependent hydrolase
MAGAVDGVRGREEDPIDASRPIVDCHHHLFDPAINHAEAVYLLDDLLSDLSDGHRVEATVYIQFGANYATEGSSHLRAVAETVFANRVAEEARARGLATRICAGIIGHADLDLGDAVEEVVLAHLDAAPARFRGIRDVVSPSPFTRPVSDERHRLLQPGYRAALSRIGKLGLSTEIMVLDFQLGEAIDAARALAHVPMVINHLGGVIDPRPSGAYDPRFAKWSADIAELARLPNVLMKLGGMSLFGVGMGWTASARPSSDALVAATERYFHHAINCFGPDRCMFESNFPVDRSAATYRVLWNAFKKITAHYDDREQNAMLSANAIRHYRLG